ncbi:MAG: homoserine dehydrogenase [Verrucomicrobiae bacterium]|nr:homoserine dehydrogenase [Verrucomicrobiae bacterium]
MHQVRIGMIGGGTVGGGVYKALCCNGDLVAERVGVRLAIKQIAVKAFDEPRKVEIPRSLLTLNWREVVNDPEVDIVVEVAGGITAAREMVLAALRLGKPVVTANKALLSTHGEELFAEARRFGTNLYFEASVAGGIPIIKALREGLVGNRIERIFGIVNGTCNYILTRMKLEGVDFEVALKEAQKAGYAEADPSLDVDGHDSLHKIGILASLAHGFWVDPQKIHVEGIRSLSRLDVEFASQLGYTIKLLGVAKKIRSNSRPASGPPKTENLLVAVYPALIPNSHVLASVNDTFNAVFVRGDVVGDTLFYGRGAGQDPTASAVLSDLVDAALDLKHNARQRLRPFVSRNKHCRLVSMNEAVSRYYVRLKVVDRPGVLAAIAAVLGKAKISISSVIQPEGHEGDVVPLILTTHEASNKAMTDALHRVAHLPVVRAQPVMIRVEQLD